MINKQEERFVEKCQREVEACENIIKVQRENKEKLINGIKKLRSQKEKEDVTKLIKEKFDQLELTSNLCNQENITNAPNSFAAAIKGQNVLPNFRKILRDERMNEIEEEHQQDRRLNGVWCQ